MYRFLITESIEKDPRPTFPLCYGVQPPARPGRHAADAPGRETDGLDFTGRHGQPRLRTKEPHMSNPLAERLDAGIVLGDSAMGTMLFDFGHATDSCL